MIDHETLNQAAVLLNKAANKLDVSGTTCDGCGRIHYGKWNEKQMKNELEAMIRKLVKFASREG